MSNICSVYLSGGLKSGWQKEFISDIDRNDIKFYNPADKPMIEKMQMDEIVCWDIHHIKKCDILFAFAEHDNPSCIGLSTEIGYAKGLGKTVILVLEPNKHIPNRYLEFLKPVADVVLNDIFDAIIFFKEMQ